jgi:hypothetical protein
MKVEKIVKNIIFLVTTVFFAGSCAEESGPDLNANVLEVSEDSLVVGQTVFFVGENFKTGGKDGKTVLHFDGVFEGDDGSQSEVDFSITPLYDGKVKRDQDEFDVLRWSRFGPFKVPFSQQQTTGRFIGQILATNVLSNGEEQVTLSSKKFEIKVEPSLIIEKFQPIGAECGAPALRALGGMPYELQVRAVGFTPSKFIYSISNINGYMGETVFEHAASGPTDSLGWEDFFVFNQVPGDKMTYITGIWVQALDDTGRGVETVLPISVHRPLEFFFEGGLKVAEYYDPIPVSGCIPGNIMTNACYQESDTETRQQSLSITISRNWNTSYSNSDSVNWHEGFSEGTSTSHSDTESASISESESAAESYGVNYSHSDSNNVGYSSTDGESWGWNMVEGVSNDSSLDRINEIHAEASLSGTVSATGEGSVPGFAKVSGTVSTTAGISGGARSGTVVGERTSVRNDRGYNGSGHHDESRSFGSTTTDSQGSTFSGAYALSSSTSAGRSVTDSEARSESRTYDIGGGSSTSETISEGMSEAESRTWVYSDSHTTLTSYCGKIPMERFGVFYRQTVRLVRKAYIRSYNLCGVSEFQADMTFTDWTWSPDMPVGDSCVPDLPESSLPEAQCVIEPCGF